jgi:hypothetical protein
MVLAMADRAARRSEVVDRIAKSTFGGAVEGLRFGDLHMWGAVSPPDPPSQAPANAKARNFGRLELYPQQAPSCMSLDTRIHDTCQLLASVPVIMSSLGSWPGILWLRAKIEYPLSGISGLPRKRFFRPHGRSSALCSPGGIPCLYLTRPVLLTLHTKVELFVSSSLSRSMQRWMGKRQSLVPNNTSWPITLIRVMLLLHRTSQREA